MNRKNFIFAAMLFTALSLGFVSCDDNKGNEPDDPQGEQTEQNGSTENNGGEETPEPTDPYNGHAYVDLGLSVKWATCNVGANNPEEYGNYYAWGETTPKTTYDWSTYKWCNGSDDTMTKYCTDSDYGTVDNKTVLDPKDDAASVNMGGSWRMPTIEEQQELINECTWTWTTRNSVKGYLVTSKINGNSIFLPAAGYRGSSGLHDAGSFGYYWSSSLSTYYSDDAYYLYFNSDDVSWSYDNRYCGLSVRGVCP